jgi:uncharacterized membrane protein YeaQ/YmgE (transglycosylase-associated protein family)
MYTTLLLKPLKDVLNHFPHYVFAAFLGSILSMYSNGQMMFVFATIILGYVSASFFYWCLNAIILRNSDGGKWIKVYIAIITVLAVLGFTYAIFIPKLSAISVTAFATLMFFLNKYFQFRLEAV